MKGDKWERWNLKIREGLIGMQVKDGTCARGAGTRSQPAPDRLGTHAGRLYLTSLSILTLEVYYRYLPIYRSFDEDQEKPDTAMKVKDDDKAKDDETPEDWRQNRERREAEVKRLSSGSTRPRKERRVRHRLVEDELRNHQSLGIDLLRHQEGVVPFAGHVKRTAGNLAHA